MKNYIAELVGTFILVFIGTGAVIVDQQYGGIITHAGISLAFGLIVMAMIHVFGNVSGAHINPAVSIAFTVANRFPLKLLPGYIISQVTGALLASFSLKFLFPANKLLGATMPRGTELQCVIIETVMTFLLMLLIMIVAHGSKEQGRFAGMAIGTLIAFEAFFGGPITGASMNPARSMAPAIASGHLEHLWIYLIAPITGATLAIPVWKYLKIINKI